MTKIKLRKGDKVRVLSGKHKGFEGPITKVFAKTGRVQIEGITINKHKKPTQDQPEGKIEAVPYLLRVDNVALIDPKSKLRTTKIGYKFVKNRKVRIARKSQAVVN